MQVIIKDYYKRNIKNQIFYYNINTTKPSNLINPYPNTAKKPLLFNIPTQYPLFFPSMPSQSIPLSTFPILLTPSIHTLLSTQYLITFPLSIPSLFPLIQFTKLGLKQSILKLKYSLNNENIIKYNIKYFVLEQEPFDENQNQFLMKMKQYCERLIKDKDYASTNQCLKGLNQMIIEKRIINGKIKQQKNMVQCSQKKIILQENTTKIQQQSQQSEQKLAQISSSATIISKIVKQNMKLHLTSKFSQFILNFKYLNVKQAMLYEALSRCQIWFTICRQRRKNCKSFCLDPLINLFNQIVKKSNIQTNPFHLSVLPRKNIQKLQQKKRVQKSKNPLFQAVLHKNYPQVKRLLLSGHNIQSPALGNQRIARQLRCSHQAVLNNDIQMCRILTSFGVDWQAQDSQKMSPLFYAIQGRSYQAMVYLIEQAKVNIQKMEIQNRTPFYWACTEGEMKYIKYLYYKGANVNHKSKLGRCPLSKACFLGRRDIVEFLLKCKEIDMNSQDEKGRTALHNATFGPKGGREGVKFGTNASDSPDCAQLLLENGFYVDLLDFQQNTSLHIATSSQALDSIKLLIAWGASMTAVNNYGQTPIMTGAKFGHIQSVKLLYQQYHSPIIQKDIFNKNIVLLVAKFRQFTQNTEKNIPKNGKIQDKIAYLQKNSQINPVFFYIVDKYIYELYSKYFKYSSQSKYSIYILISQKQKSQNLSQLHFTFRQLLYNGIHEQFMFFTKRLFYHQIPFPRITLDDAKFLLQMQHLLNQQQQQYQIVLKILHSKNQSGYHVFQLEHEKIYDFITWLIKKNNVKLLEFASDNQIILFYHFNKKLKYEEIQQGYDYELPMELLIKQLLKLKQKVISFCLLNLGFNWLDYEDKQTKQNIFHFLIRSKKIGTIIQLTKLFSGKKMQFIKNKFIRYFLSLQQQLQHQKTLQSQKTQFQSSQYNFIQSPLNKKFFQLINHKDINNLTPYQLAHIVKQPSIIKILSERVNQSILLLGEQQQGENNKNISVLNQSLQKLDIKQYRVQKQTQNLSQLKLFQQGYQLQPQLQHFLQQISSCQSIQSLSIYFPILTRNPSHLHASINLDIDFLSQWSTIKSRPLYYIKKIQQIDILIQLLKQPFVGIDIEYDFTQSKQKQTIICILQFSSIQKDYVVDMMWCTYGENNNQNMFKLFVYKLKTIFFQPLAYNPKITKLMHGSDHDLYILKSYFNCSFINFLDSSRIDLDLSSSFTSIRGLSTLTKQYLSIQMNKQLQVSQWRIRPLPYVMIDYARRDAMVMGFLVRKMLINCEEVGKLKEVIVNSAKHAKKNKKINQPLINNLVPI